MTDGSWDEFQRRNIEQYGESQQRAWQSTVEFWKHLVMVEATVVGLTVGLLGAGGKGAPMLLVLAWVALLLGIFVGCVLIRAGIEAEQSRKRTGFLTTHDLAEVQRRVKAGELRVESDEYQGLVVAAMMQSTPEWERKKIFSAKAEETAARWSDKLPYGRFLKPGHAPLYKWLERYLVRVEMIFYALSVTAFVLTVLTVIAPLRAAESRSAPTTAAARPGSPRVPAMSPDTTSRDTGVTSARTSGPTIVLKAPDSAKDIVQSVREPVSVMLPTVVTQPSRDWFDWLGLIGALLIAPAFALYAALLGARRGSEAARRAAIEVQEREASDARRLQAEERAERENHERALLLRRFERDLITACGITAGLRTTQQVTPVMPVAAANLRAMWDSFVQRRDAVMLLNDPDVEHEVEFFYGWAFSRSAMFETWLATERELLRMGNPNWTEIHERAGVAEHDVQTHVQRAQEALPRVRAYVEQLRARDTCA